MTRDVGLEFGAHSQHTPEIRAAIEWLKTECGVTDSGAEQLMEYIIQGRAMLGAVPTTKRIVAERFFDEGGGMQLIIHAPFGGRINRAWGLALRKKFCRSFNFELQAAATEDGLSIALAEQHSFPLGDVFYFLAGETVKHTLQQASIPSPIFATRWRWDAMRSLALLRFMGGKKVPPYLQRLRSDDLLAAVFPQAAACQDNVPGDIELPDHPLINEVMKDVLTEAMDLEGLERIIAGIKSGDIRCIAVDTPTPSQFAAEIINANVYAYLDDAGLEERRTRAVQMRRVLPGSIAGELGQLDPQAIARVIEQSWPDIQSADELHDLMLSVVAVPETSARLFSQPGVLWSEFMSELSRRNRATRMTIDNCQFWVATERIALAELIWPHAKFEKKLPVISNSINERSAAVLAALRGWMNILGPTTVQDVSDILHLQIGELELAFVTLESEGRILRGQFKDQGRFSTVVTGLASRPVSDYEWCDRRLLARVHKLTLATLRRGIEPVTAAAYARWLCHWQHVAPGTQLVGERGLLEVLRQLQGFEVPARDWEAQILSKRVKNYKPELLDSLCLKGAVGWGRLSSHPSLEVSDEKTISPGDAANAHGYPQHKRRKNIAPLAEELTPGVIKRVIPTSVAPVTFFVRDDADWISALPKTGANIDILGISNHARSVESLLSKRGASFFADVVRGTGLTKIQTERALWELVTAGIVTADGFANLRLLIDPARAELRPGRSKRFRDSAYGRWSLLHSDQPVEKTAALEAMCRVLLRRYGVVFRNVVLRESNLPPWRELLAVFRSLEDRGEVRGGRFVNGFIGEQFALPEAVDSLRASRHTTSSETIVRVAQTDPTNLIGTVLPAVENSNGQKYMQISFLESL
jgi:ATP-dependent Lhr-like helicase